jgi:hypothetical protein
MTFKAMIFSLDGIIGPRHRRLEACGVDGQGKELVAILEMGPTKVKFF